MAQRESDFLEPLALAVNRRDPAGLLRVVARANGVETRIQGAKPPIFTFGPDLKGSAVFGCVATPASGHGVVMFVKYDANHSKVFLYKHAAGSDR